MGRPEKITPDKTIFLLVHGAANGKRLLFANERRHRRFVEQTWFYTCRRGCISCPFWKKIDTPEYKSDIKKTVHHYVTVGKAKEKNGPIEFGPKYLALQEAQKGSAKEEIKAKTVIPSGERLVLDKAFTETGLSKVLAKNLGKDLAAKVGAYHIIFLQQAMRSPYQRPGWRRES